ncbi:hypothetical protein SDC9_170653 [bioreactor metagenome]|uniref:Uncharacterized protein n=1 Tax=bioreactor metagenome TaxID=1076179 RepID=A0A645G9E4_9ZZZZ
MTVVTAFELDDRITPGKATGEPDRTHRRLGTGADQTYHLERRQHLAQQLRHLDLAFGRCAKGQTFQRGLSHRLDNGRVSVPGNRRPPRADVIDIGLAISVPHSRPFGTIDEARRATHRAKGANRRIDATRNGLLGAFEKCCVTTGHGGMFGLFVKTGLSPEHDRPVHPHNTQSWLAGHNAA